MRFVKLYMGENQSLALFLKYKKEIDHTNQIKKLTIKNYIIKYLYVSFLTLKAFLIGISGLVAAAGLIIYNQSINANLLAGGGAKRHCFRDYNGDGVKQASEPLVAG